MQDSTIRVLLVDDERADSILTKETFAEIKWSAFVMDWADTFEKGLVSILRQEHDVYLIDYRLGGRDGLELLRTAIAKGCMAPMILLTGLDDHEVDMEAMKAGAMDYLVKGELSPALLERSIRYSLERKRVENLLRKSRSELFAQHEEMKQLYEHLELKNRELLAAQETIKSNRKFYEAQGLKLVGEQN